MGTGGWIDGFLDQERLPPTYRGVIEGVVRPLARWVETQRSADHTFFLGLCGPQASGKSTLAQALACWLRDQGRSVAVLSLDDLYLSRTARASLAASVHELFATRGPPGTHDVALGEAVLEQLRQPGRVALPRFSKAEDEPQPMEKWPVVATPVDVVLFEGWCVGARAQGASALATPINDLEADRDPHGVWRGYVDEQLAGPYARLFTRLDRLVYLRPPSFGVVTTWRQEQEAKLRERLALAGLPPGRAMGDADVPRFIQHYERLTRAMIEDLPERADLTLQLAEDRSSRPLLA